MDDPRANDPRAKMDGNGLLGLGAPRGDWSKTPGRVPGFWLALAGLVLAVPVPAAGFIVAALGVLLSRRALAVIPAGARGRRLALAAIVLAGGAILVALLRILA